MISIGKFEELEVYIDIKKGIIFKYKKNTYNYVDPLLDFISQLKLLKSYCNQNCFIPLIHDLWTIHEDNYYPYKNSSVDLFVLFLENNKKLQEFLLLEDILE